MVRSVRNARIQRAVVAALAGMACSSTASAAVLNGTITWNNNAGTGNLLDLANWSNPNGVTATTGNTGAAPDWIIGDSAVAQGDWGVGNASNNSAYYLNSVVFDRATDFTVSNLAGSNILYLITGNIATNQAHTYTLPRLANSSGTGAFNLSLVGGSTLVNTASLPNASTTVVNLTRTGTGTGTFDYRPGGTTTLGTLNTGADTKFIHTLTQNSTGYSTTVNNLTGSGEVQNKMSQLVLKASGFNFSGTVRSSAGSLGNTGFVVFNTQTNTDAAYTFTGGKFAVDSIGASKSTLKSVTDGTFQGSEFSGSGYISFTDRPGSTTGSNGSTSTIRKMTLAGGSIKPGTGSTAGILEVIGNLEGNTYNGQRSKLYVDVTGTGAVAGVDFDQLLLSPTSTALTTDRGGKISSTGDANALASFDLIVNIAPGLNQADISADVLQFVKSNAATPEDFRTFTFGSVTVSGGSAVVQYNNGNVSLANITVPEPGVICLLGATSMLLGLRRRRA